MSLVAPPIGPVCLLHNGLVNLPSFRPCFGSSRLYHDSNYINVLVAKRRIPNDVIIKKSQVTACVLQLFCYTLFIRIHNFFPEPRYS